MTKRPCVSSTEEKDGVAARRLARDVSLCEEEEEEEEGSRGGGGLQSLLRLRPLKSGRSRRGQNVVLYLTCCDWAIKTRRLRVSACACRHRHGPVDVLAVRLQSKLFLDSSSPVSRLCEQDGQHLRSSFAAAAGRLGVCRLIFVRLRPISLRCRFGRHVWINLGQFHPGTGRQL